MVARSLGGVPLVSFEAQRSDALARLFSRRGANVLRAPAQREIASPQSPEGLALVRRLRAGEVHAVVFPSAVGARALGAALSRTAPDFPALLERAATLSQRPDAATALREMGVRASHAVPPPHTWRETLAVLDTLGLAEGTMVAVQEYGQEPAALLLGLAARGHEVLRVPIHRWALPADIAPLLQGIDAICRHEARIAVFTSATQVEHLFRVAGEPERLRAALGEMIVASIGPECSEALEAHGVVPTLESGSPQIAPLVDLVAARAPALLCRR